MLLATSLSDLNGLRTYSAADYRIIKQKRKSWMMDDQRRRRYATPYTTTTATMDNLLLPDGSMLYSNPFNMAHPGGGHPAPGAVPDEYLYSTIPSSSAGSYYASPQPQPQQYMPQTTYNTSNNTAGGQWLHPSQAAPGASPHSHHSHSRSYQDSIPSSDLDPDYDVDLDVDLELDLDIPAHSHSHTHTSNALHTSNTTSTAHTHTHSHPSRTPSSSSTSGTQNTKDLTLYGTPSPTHPGSWRCAYPSCTSRSLFRRGCDLRKHYNRHRKHLFCRHDGCPQANASVPGAGFSSKKDRDRHEAKHNPGIRCEWVGEGCTRVFSRVDNMKDHVRRIHKGV